MLSKFECNRAKPFFGAVNPGLRKMRSDLLACYRGLKKAVVDGTGAPRCGPVGAFDAGKRTTCADVHFCNRSNFYD